jgi:RNA polymerase sigma-70 factor (ECF subfamily)
LSYLKALRDGFGDILLACQASLYRYARSLSRDPMVAEELVQETYRRALAAQHKPAPSTEESTRAWLFTILRNLWQNELRHRNRWVSSSIPVEDVQVHTEPLDAQVTRKLLQYEVRLAIDSLPEAFREVVILRDIEGLSYSEIARILECPSGTVMSRLARARDSLRKILNVPSPGDRELKR